MHTNRMVSTLFLVMAVGVYAFAQRQMYPPWPPKDQAGAWEIKIDENNRLSMTRFYPYGAVDRWISIFIENNSQSPQSGAARFPNSHTSEIVGAELAYFWDYTGAKYAYELHRNKSRSK